MSHPLPPTPYDDNPFPDDPSYDPVAAEDEALAESIRQARQDQDDHQEFYK